MIYIYILYCLSSIKMEVHPLLPINQYKSTMICKQQSRSECQHKATWEDHLSCPRAPASKQVSKTKTLQCSSRYRWESDTSRSYSKILEASYRGNKFLWQNPTGSSPVQSYCNEWELQRSASQGVVHSVLTKLKKRINNGSFLLSM